MAYEDMLTSLCRILRKQNPNLRADDNDWGYDSGKREPVYTAGGDWIPCYYTDKSGTEIINVAGVDVRVSTEVDLLPDVVLNQSDRLQLDDGRVVEVLAALRTGGIKVKAKCGSRSGIQAI